MSYSDDQIRRELFTWAGDLQSRRSDRLNAAAAASHVNYRPLGYIPPSHTPSFDAQHHPTLSLRDPSYFIAPKSEPRPVRSSKSKRILHFLDRVAAADVPRFVLDMFEVR